MKSCAELCYKKNKECKEKDCRMWLDYADDLNCTHIAIKKNGRMTLKEVGFNSESNQCVYESSAKIINLLKVLGWPIELQKKSYKKKLSV